MRDGAGRFHQVVQDVQLQSQQSQLKWGPMWFQDSFGEPICLHKICFSRRGQMGRQWPPQNYDYRMGHAPAPGGYTVIICYFITCFWVCMRSGWQLNPMIVGSV